MTKILTLAAGLLAAALCASCHPQGGREEHDHAKHHDGEERHEAHNPDEIHMDERQAQSAGLRTERVSPAPFAATIRVGGAIESAPGAAIAIVAPQAGLVSMAGDGLAEGMFVEAGQTLATISGKTLQEGDAALRAKLDYEAARKELARAKELVKDNIISAKEFEQAELRHATAKAAYDATASRQTAGGVAVKAGTSGHIVRRAVEQGQYAGVGQTLFVIEHCGRKRLRADVPERHYGDLGKVASANFSVASSQTVQRLDQMGGKLVSFGKAMEAGTPYIPVTFEFSDPREDFIAGQYADVTLTLNCGKEALSVPTEAVIESQGLNFVYVKNPGEAGSYLRREVRLGSTDGIRVEVLSGLTAGEEVVTAGARRLHLAGASAAIPAHTHNH